MPFGSPLRRVPRTADDADYELDLFVLGPESFVSQASSRFGIRDMSIQEVPIESAIKDLYRGRQ